MRKKTKEEVLEYCNLNNIDLIKMRNINTHNKKRLVLTIKCRQCGNRYDIRYDTIRHQLYKGLCTKCAHYESQNYKRLEVLDVVKRFNEEGFKVLTPIEKIKPRGNKTIYFTTVDIQNKYGDVYSTNCNNFCSRIDYYRELSNCDSKNEKLKNESRLEYKVRKFLQENNVPYKQQFRYSDCRGKKYPLPFDFALYYEQDNRLLIEVDGEQHFNIHDKFWSKEVEKHDRIKNYYCESHNIPLLRLSYKDIDNQNEIYKEKITNFINNNR